MTKKRAPQEPEPPRPPSADALLPAFAGLFLGLVRAPSQTLRSLRGRAAFETDEALLACLPFIFLTLTFLFPLAGARRAFRYLQPEFLRGPAGFFLAAWALSVLLSPFAFHETAARLGSGSKREPTVCMATMVLIGYALIRRGIAVAAGLPPVPSPGDLIAFLPAAGWAAWIFSRHARLYYGLEGRRAHAAAAVMVALGVVLPAVFAAGAANALP